ncbi:Two-pore potassium channel 3 [Striga hermonthica]|uniref:Two-pore potassium channel 3 n=1 Tax=Striga hermonthica TaxID=68872 RepID=A0A9N7RK30_STRHE|nr:Two-pore potassium channel 3 [Striga hermonthica]
MVNINEIDQQFPPPKPPQFGKPSIVRQGVLLLILYLSLGVLIYSFSKENFRGNETHPVVDALYFCIVTMHNWENYLLRTIKGSYIIDAKKGRMRIRMKVGLALGVVVLCIGIGVMFMHYVERLGWLDSLYLSVMSVTTVGYGDRVFNSLAGRVFAAVWLLVSTLAVARAFLYLAEARVDKRHRMMAKWVLSQDMTVEQFLAADTENNGFVSKSEYVIYMLKEMGKVSEREIFQICKQFERLESRNCGKIYLADLMEGHHR